RSWGRAFFLRTFGVDARRWLRWILNPPRRSFKLRVLVDRQRPMKNVTLDRATALQLDANGMDSALDAAADCHVLRNDAALDLCAMIWRSEARTSPSIRPKTCAGPLHSMLPTIDMSEPMQEAIPVFVVGSDFAQVWSCCTTLPMTSAALTVAFLSFSGVPLFVLVNMSTSCFRRDEGAMRESGRVFETPGTTALQADAGRVAVPMTTPGTAASRFNFLLKSLRS